VGTFAWTAGGLKFDIVIPSFLHIDCELVFIGGEVPCKLTLSFFLGNSKDTVSYTHMAA
jgi:hypothetical protein